MTNKVTGNNNTFRLIYLSIIITRKRNKPHGSSKSTRSPGALNQPNTITKRWPFKPTEESPCFLWGPSKCVTEAKNVNVSYNFDLRSPVIEKRVNGLLGVICKVLNRKTYWYLPKVPIIFWKKLCFEYVIVIVLFFVFFTSWWSTHNQCSWAPVTVVAL